MRSDDPRLEASRKAMIERVEKFNALMLTTIKGHLLIEQAIDGFLEVSLSDPEHIHGARFGFADKVRLCRAMSFDQSEDQFWTVVGNVNGLRNAIAHGKPDGKIAEAMRTLRVEFLDSLTPEQAKGIEGQPDDQITESACVTAAGFLGALTNEAKDRRKVLDEHWRSGEVNL